MSNPNSSEPLQALPTAAQVAETRLKQWHQQGEALLTAENLRSWINAAGLVLFAPRPQISAPAPTLVEAVIGTPAPNPTMEQTREARRLLARLMAEGIAVPLNLLGAGAGTVSSDTPDFVASTAVFSYIFTLRGDKAWKQPPSNTGPLKVSNLAVAVYEALLRRGPSTAYDLATEVGKEVTEAAVLRALTELWTHLRVLPVEQQDEAAALWELSSARFTKQIKAGANAGQPSALSALISLYLGQAVVATEEEIEVFLSPVAPRSRTRDVIHALLAARELETIAVEGRTMLHVAGALPAFLSAAAAPLEAGEEQARGADAPGTLVGDGADGESPRIKKFVPPPKKVGTGYLAKGKPSQSAPKQFADKSGFKRGFKPRAQDESKGDRERRPFNRPTGGFKKPWEAQRGPRPAGGRKPQERFADGGESRETPRFTPRQGPGAGGARFKDQSGFRGKPENAEWRGAKRGPSGKFPRPEALGEKRERFAERGRRQQGDARKPFESRPNKDARTGRQEFRKFKPAGAPRPDHPRGEDSKRDFRKFDAPRDRPFRPKRGDGADSSQSAGGFAKRGFGGKHPGKPGGLGPKKPGRPGFGERGGFSKPTGGKAGGGFAKFAGKKKNAPARRPKPSRGESA